MFDFDFSDPDEPPHSGESPRSEENDGAEDVSGHQPLHSFEEVLGVPAAADSDVDSRLEESSEDEPLIGFEEVPVSGKKLKEHPVPSPIERVLLPQIDEKVTVSQQSWVNAAKLFGEMILSLQRVDCKAGRGWFQGMRKLLNCRMDGDWGFSDFAARLIINHLLAWESPHPWANSFRKLFFRLETKVVEATRSVDPACDWTSDKDMYDDKFKSILRQEASFIPLDDIQFASYGGRSRLFVGLPLCMYVSDCSHLYTLVQRLRSLRLLAAKGLLTAKSMLATLNADDKPYAILVFAIIAALQVLHSSRVPGKSKKGAAGLEALCASAHPGVRNQFGASMSVSVASDHFENPRDLIGTPGGKASTRQDGKVSGGKALVFRGIWISKMVDEDAVTCTWSLNSFSRSLEGALWVLDFYATGAADMAARMLAQQTAHAFIYVGRFYADPPELLFPIQFFNSGTTSDIEKEVLVPPFVRYVFEKGVDGYGQWDSISNRQDHRLRVARLEEIERRWGIRFQDECPLLKKLLFDRNSRLCFVPGVKQDLDVTVRFIQSIEPAEPIRDIFGTPNQPPENLLLKFPADGDIVDNRFGAGDSALLAHYQDAIISGQFDKKEVQKHNMALRHLNAGVKQGFAPEYMAKVNSGST